MKKFGIFLLGIIVAVIGFYFLSNKTEPLPDNPPSNIEQPGDENEQPGDDNETPTPDNPGDVGSEIQYTTNTFSIDNIANFQLFKLAEDNVTFNSVDTTNGLDQTQLEVGAIYTLHLNVAYGYEIVEVVYNSNCLLSAPIELSVQVTFTAVENGVFSVTTQIIESELPENYGVPIPVNFMVSEFELFSSIKLYNNALEPVVVSSDMMDHRAELLIGHSYTLELEAVNGYVISQVDYLDQTGLEIIYTGKTQVALVTFIAPESGDFAISIMPVGYGTPVFNTFSLENIETVAIYEGIDFVYDKLDTSAGLDNIELKLGTYYRVLLMPKNGFTISSVIYNGETQFRYSDASSSIYAVGFQAVDNATFEVVTEASSFTIGTTTNTFRVRDPNIVNLFKVEADGSLTHVDTSNGIENTELTVGEEYCLEVVADEGYTVSSFSYGGVPYTFENTSSSTVYCNFIAADHNGDLIVRFSPVE